MDPLIAILDYDVGNVAAVANMLKRLGHRAVVTADDSMVREASKLILPGNGSFDACMKNLKSTGLLALLERRVMQERVPLLGICVGAQMLGYSSAEGSEPGLGWLDMVSERFPSTIGLPIPHMGWTDTKLGESSGALTDKLAEANRFYFVHSYYMVPSHQSDVFLWASYGVSFAAGVCSGNIFGVQFHPEKSHRHGKILLDAFAQLNA